MFVCACAHDVVWQNHAAGDEHGEAWTGHLKHSKAYRDMQVIHTYIYIYIHISSNPPPPPSPGVSFQVQNGISITHNSSSLLSFAISCHFSVDLVAVLRPVARKTVIAGCFTAIRVCVTYGNLWLVCNVRQHVRVGNLR